MVAGGTPIRLLATHAAHPEPTTGVTVRFTGYDADYNEFRATFRY